MEIGKITLTEKELHEAVQSWLESKGLKVAVACVQRTAAYRDGGWEVTSIAESEETEATPAPKPASNRELGICVEGSCKNTATKTGDTDHDRYYCDKHKQFCAAADCITRISMTERFCDAHKAQPAAPVELPKESPL